MAEWDYVLLGFVPSPHWRRGLEFDQLIRRFIGICTMGQGLTKTFGGLVVCRALMGFFEAGFVPGEYVFINLARRSSAFHFDKHTGDLNAI